MKSADLLLTLLTFADLGGQQLKASNHGTCSRFADLLTGSLYRGG